MSILSIHTRVFAVLCVATGIMLSLLGGTAIAQHADSDAVEDSYAAAHGLNISEARERLVAHAAAGRVQTKIRDLLGSRFAGVWIDPATGQVQVGLAPGSNLELLRSGLAAGGILSKAEIRPVFASERELMDGQMRLIKWFQNEHPESHVTSGIAPQSNSVVVELVERTEAAATSSEELERIARVPVRVDRVKHGVSRVTPNACSYPNCDRPLRGGVRIGAFENLTSGGNTCTAGFIARSPQTNARYVVTAGHCLLDAPLSLWYAKSPTYGVRSIRTSFANEILQAYRSGSGDAGLIRISSNSFWNPNTLTGAFAHWGVNPDGARALSKRESIVGEFQCRWGSYTYNGGACGNVLLKNVWVTTTDGHYVGGLTRTAGCGVDGDSGGPVYAYNYTALGVHMGSTFPNCTGTPAWSYFTEITRIENAFGIQIVLGP